MLESLKEFLKKYQCIKITEPHPKDSDLIVPEFSLSFGTFKKSPKTSETAKKWKWLNIESKPRWLWEQIENTAQIGNPRKTEVQGYTAGQQVSLWNS